MRADARRNRDRITAAALDLFAARGPDVPMDDIARAAGLGVGTLYRHFPDRCALVEEIAAAALTDLCAAAEAALDRPGPRWDAFTALVDHCAGRPLALVKSLSDRVPGPAESDGLQRRFAELLCRLAADAQREGGMRTDLAPADVLAVLSTAVCRPGARAGDPLVTVVLDGLRAPAS
ncbi:TetR/AcrR family transcriptional regulator [Actinomadura atramentaria]|uniref:TetR/AcrR family transcriptional regulator n=1 Tax=Actinomadura atramentaria TaxID=1990 RepID=UPI000377D4E8|nr:TetR/AcrR family transcriptional regulator [Actinomadura atramentaria]